MSYTPSNISDKSSVVYGSSGVSSPSTWQTIGVVFDARTGFSTEYKVNSDFAIRLRVPHFQVVSELDAIPVRASFIFDFISDDEISFEINAKASSNLKDIAFSIASAFEVLPVYTRNTSVTFDSSFDLFTRIAVLLQEALEFNLESSITLDVSRIIPNGILQQFNDNISDFSLDAQRITKISPSIFDSESEFEVDTRSITPVDAVVIPDFVVESTFYIDQFIPNKKPTFLSDSYIQPLGYEYINRYRVSLITFRKIISLFFNAITALHWTNVITVRCIENLEFNSTSDFSVDTLANIVEIFIKIFNVTSSFLISERLIHRILITISSLSSFMILDSIYVKGIYPEVFLRDSHFEFIDTTPIKRRIDVLFNVLSVFEFLITFWREGRPAIRVATLHQDTLRKPRGMIVILEDPTL